MNETNTELYEKFSKLQWMLHKLHLRKNAENGPMCDTTRGQGRILAILKLQDGISTKDLSYLLGIRVSSLNELIAKMEKTGYVTREPSEADKRVMLVKLTEKGRNEQQREWNSDDIFSCLSQDEQRFLGEYLDRVTAAIEAEIGYPADEDERGWWMRNARERMGDELFERLISMKCGSFVPHEGFDPHGAFHDMSRMGHMDKPGTPHRMEGCTEQQH